MIQINEAGEGSRRATKCEASRFGAAFRGTSNGSAQSTLRGFALGRKSWLFAGSDRGADRAAIMATLIMTAKLNDIDPQAWLADVLARIAALPQGRLHELLWNWSVHVRSVAPPQAA
jgi:transposase